MVLDVVQRSPEWLEARAGLLTASDAAALYATRQDGKEPAARRNLRARLVDERRFGAGPGKAASWDMQRGVNLEPEARGAYEAETGQLVREVGFIRHDKLHAGASPDGLVGDDGLIEIKCPRLKGHMATVEGKAIPALYEPQCLHLLWLTGRTWVDFVSYCPADESGEVVDPALCIVRVYATEAERASHELLVRQFLREVDRIAPLVAQGV